MKKILGAGAMAAAFAALSGCASVVTGTSEVVKIESEPPGATVQIDGRHMGTTPRLVKLHRGGSKQVMLYKEGFEAETLEIGTKINGWFFGNVFLGLLPGIVDMANGSWMWIEPDAVSVTLRKKGEPRPEPLKPEAPKPEEKKPEEEKKDK
jgi:hypothetical protein